MKLKTDWLRNNCLQDPYFFGLGFIQLKIDLQTRLHFYTTRYTPIVSDTTVHNHRYNFISHVLKGEIINEIFSYEAGPSNYIHELVTCETNHTLSDADKNMFEVNLKVHHRHVIKEGQSYLMAHTDFHSVHTTKPTITYLLRGHRCKEVVKKFASIIRLKDDDNVCPFSKKISTDECWEIIDEMIC